MIPVYFRRQDSGAVSNCRRDVKRPLGFQPMSLILYVHGINSAYTFSSRHRRVMRCEYYIVEVYHTFVKDQQPYLGSKIEDEYSIKSGIHGVCLKSLAAVTQGGQRKDEFCKIAGFYFLSGRAGCYVVFASMFSVLPVDRASLLSSVASEMSKATTKICTA